MAPPIDRRQRRDFSLPPSVFLFHFPLGLLRFRRVRLTRRAAGCFSKGGGRRTRLVNRAARRTNHITVPVTSADNEAARSEDLSPVVYSLPFPRGAERRLINSSLPERFTRGRPGLFVRPCVCVWEGERGRGIEREWALPTPPLRAVGHMKREREEGLVLNHGRTDFRRSPLGTMTFYTVARLKLVAVCAGGGKSNAGTCSLACSHGAIRFLFSA